MTMTIAGENGILYPGKTYLCWKDTYAMPISVTEHFWCRVPSIAAREKIVKAVDNFNTLNLFPNGNEFEVVSWEEGAYLFDPSHSRPIAVKLKRIK
jgi:hypothetical protein